MNIEKLKDWKWRVDEIRDSLLHHTGVYSSSMFDEWSVEVINLKTLSERIKKAIEENRND